MASDDGVATFVAVGDIGPLRDDAEVLFEPTRDFVRVALHPAWINPQAQAELLSPQDPRYAEVLDYLRYLTDYYSLNAVFKTDGDEIVVSAAGE